MNIHIGSKIKSLRTARHVTQEQLATYLGVTPQAISRWEGGNGYPDLELLPSIASYFSVTVDELLDIDRSAKEKRLSEIYAAIKERNELGEDTKETISKARLWAVEFPGEERIQMHLANTLCRFTMWEEQPDWALLKEAEKIYRTLIETTADTDFRNEVLEVLAALYGVGFRDAEKALETADRLPAMVYCRESVKSSVLATIHQRMPSVDHRIYTQNYLEKLTDGLGFIMTEYVINDLSNEPARWDEKIDYFQRIIDLYTLIFGEEMLFYHGRVAYLYRVIATYKVAQGKSDETLDCLEKMTEHAIAAGKAKPGEKYTSPFMDQMAYPGSTDDFDALIVHNDAFYCLEKMAQDRYDCIRENPRFQAVVDRLQAYAK